MTVGFFVTLSLLVADTFAVVVFWINVIQWKASVPVPPTGSSVPELPPHREGQEPKHAPLCFHTATPWRQSHIQLRTQRSAVAPPRVRRHGHWPESGDFRIWGSAKRFGHE